MWFTLKPVRDMTRTYNLSFRLFFSYSIYHEEATGCIIEEAIGTIKETAIGVTVAPRNLPSYFFI